ncbi:hypothetical protein GQ457_06G011100 [Hibiscus cannabinus]
MSEKDKTLFFLEGLKHLARTEIVKQRPKMVTEEMVDVERLNDFNDSSVKRKAPTLAFDCAGRGNDSHNGIGSRNENGSGNGNGNGLTNPKAARVDRTPTWGSDRGKMGDASRPGLRYFLCKGPHWVAECPKRSSINALRTTTGEPNENDDPLDNTEEGPTRVGSIRFLYDLCSELDKVEFEKEKGLMYIDIELNGVALKALVDMGEIDTFITTEEAERCNLNLSKGKVWMKAVNSGAAVVWGCTKNMKTKVGPCEGNMDYTMVLMDDFDVVLGLDFMVANQVIPVPAMSSVMFQGDRPGCSQIWCLTRCRLFEVMELVQSTRTSTS